MANDSYFISKTDIPSAVISSPKKATLNFIRQFARTCATLQGCAIGTMMLN